MAGTFLTRLLKDTRANTLAIGAAAVIPLVGLVGGGIDASRMYLAKSRLQQACDSATLAARKKLGGSVVENGAIPAAIQTTADNFFETNFGEGMYGSENVEFDIEAGTATRMDGTASVEVPTTLMGIFGYEKVELNVECSAELNLPNIDVMMVLDVSGSMGGSRIQGLKDAVFSFYDEVMAVKPDEAQLRIGVVPYNAAVNVGGALVTENPDFIADSHTYQSREPRFRQVSNNDGVDIGDVIGSTTTVEILPRETVQLGSTNQSHYHWNENASVHRNFCRNSYAGTYMVDGVRWVISNTRWRNNYWPAWPRNQKAACEATIQKDQLAGPDDVRPPTYRNEFDGYEYKPIVFDTSAFKAGSTVATNTGTGGALVNSTWNGCIEERGAIVPISGTLPVAGAFDLDIDLVPDASDPDTQWKAHWPQVTYSRNTVAPELTTTDRSLRSSNCPAAAVRLQEWPLSGTARNAAFETYINGLAAGGNTSHDNGMLWGARFVSPTGIFAEENESAPNGDPISRHIIFMTDGTMEPGPSVYGTLGNYGLDGRFFGFGPWSSNSQLAAYQNPRLAAICEQAKNQNITVWTVTFGLAQNTWTRSCASGPQRAYEAASSAQLASAFRLIATSIAELRLVQ